MQGVVVAAGEAIRLAWGCMRQGLRGGEVGGVQVANAGGVQLGGLGVPVVVQVVRLQEAARVQWQRGSRPMHVMQWVWQRQPVTHWRQQVDQLV